jgi:hypothetical protein
LHRGAPANEHRYGRDGDPCGQSPRLSTLGGGLSCPKISIGGVGPTIMSIGVGPTNSGKLTVTGNAVAPTGYSITSLLGLF